MNSSDFLNKDIILTRMLKNFDCYASVITIMEEYRAHIEGTPKENQKGAKEFLDKDIILTKMLKNFDCYAGVITIMEEYRNHIEEVPKEKSEH